MVDEAEALGDRIGIIHAGEIQCCASSYFLRKRYGVGYTLSIEMAPACMPDNITAVLRRYIANIRIGSIAGTDLSYMLPKEHTSRFSGMLSEIESSTDKLAIRGFRIAATDVEEVYLKVASGKVKPMKKQRAGKGAPVYKSEKVATGLQLWINHALAMCIKKITYLRITILDEFILKILIPAIFIIIVLCVKSEIVFDVGYEERRFTMRDYPGAVTLIDQFAPTEFENELRTRGMNVERVGNIPNHILSLAEEDPFTARYKYVIGYSFSLDKDGKDQVNIFFNNEPYHALPLGVQFGVNYLYQKIRGPEFELMFSNYPWRLEPEDVYRTNVMLQNMRDAFYLSILLCFYGSFLIKFHVIEEHSGFKQIQLMSGMNLVIFHIVPFLIDVGISILEMVLVMIMICMFEPYGVDTLSAFWFLFAVYICFVVAIIPLSILIARFFRHPCHAAVFMLFLIILTGPAILYPAVTSKHKDMEMVRYLLRLLSPSYAATDAIFNIMWSRIGDAQTRHCVKMGSKEKSCVEFLCSAVNYCGHEAEQAIGDVFILLIYAAVVYGIVFLMDVGLLRLSIIGIRRPKYGDKMDEEVKRDIDYIKSHKIKEMKTEYMVIMRELTKYYLLKRVVNGLTFMAKNSECVGLLGIKGAGKTTAIRMMTGDVSIGYGQGWINGFNIKTRFWKIRQIVGYCPQKDAFIEKFNVRTTVQIFCLIRGVPRKEYKAFTEKMVKQFELEDRIDETIETLSSVNKRKLSIGIAFMGDSLVIFMDEPTTGMDPLSKRNLWTQVNKFKNSGKSVIVASSGLDECEALCSRVAIMRKGDVQCMGSMSKLKGKYAKGFLLTFKLKKPKTEDEVQDTTDIENFMKQKFPKAELKEKEVTHMNYRMESTEMKWSQLFDTLEYSKRSLKIEDYSIGQPTLEQIFLKISSNPADLNDEADPKKRFWLF